MRCRIINMTPVTIADQKAQEISAALIKLSVYMRREGLRKVFESLAFNLLGKVASRDIAGFQAIISEIESLTRFGKNLYEIEPVNAEIIIAEIGNLNAAMRQIAELPLPDSSRTTNISGIFGHDGQSLFSKSEESVPQKSVRKQVSKAQSRGEDKNKEVKDLQEESGKSAGENNDDQAIRQSAIVEKIRQSGNKAIQLKDIVAGFPSFSERTVRYDLQRLCNQGIIERIGQGGPATYYRIRVI